MPFYPAGTFDAGLQLGPFLRMTSFHLPDRRAIEPPAEGDRSHRALEPIYHDVEFARASGRNAIFSGVLVGGKFIMGGNQAEFTWLRGFTFQGGLMLGYQHLLGSSRFGPDPSATRKGHGMLSQIYMELGWSF